MLERSSSPSQWQQHARAELLSASVVSFAMYASPYTGSFPPNPMASISASSTGPPADDGQWAGWLYVSDQEEEMTMGDPDYEEAEGAGAVDCGLADDDEPAVGQPDGAPRRPRAVGPGGRRCIVATTFSSGAHLRFSDSNML
jgi:hypothetical protein